MRDALRILGALACLAGGRADAATDLDALAGDPAWRALVHVEPGARRSEVLPGPFFLAPDGVADPRAELAATLAALAADPALGDAHAACRYPARTAWLAAQDPALAPVAPRCAELDAFRARLGGGRAWLVFPSAFLGAPQSMFGHTLLRIAPDADPDAARLADHAINFAAEQRGVRGIRMVIAGLGGGLQSGYSVVPYYEKVRTYSDLESRDVWEYPLALDRAALRRIVDHAWEMREARFEYRFVDANCSYHLLTLFEVARPGLELRPGFRRMTVPLETVRALREAGFIAGEGRYHESIAARVDRRLAALGAPRRARAEALADGAPPVAGEDPAVVAAAYDLIDFRVQRGDCPLEDCQPRGRRLLAAVAPERMAEFVAADAPPTPRAPELTHGTSQWRAGVAAAGDHGDARFGWRAIGHGLLDPGDGSLRYGSVSALDLELVARDGGRLALERLTLLDLRSYPPAGSASGGRSWRLALGAERRLAGGSRPLSTAFDARIGPGSWAGTDALAFTTVGLRLAFDDALPGGRAVAAGWEVGARWQPTPRLRLALEHWRQATLDGRARATGRSALGADLDLGPTLGLRFEARHERAGALERSEGVIGVVVHY